LDARADFVKIALRGGSAVAEYFASSPLIPIDAAVLNDLIEEPALFAPAAHFAFGFDSHGASGSVQGSRNEIKIMKQYSSDEKRDPRGRTHAPYTMPNPVRNADPRLPKRMPRMARYRRFEPV
jgi:hypothetical protein